MNVKWTDDSPCQLFISSFEFVLPPGAPGGAGYGSPVCRAGLVLDVRSLTPCRISWPTDGLP